jgi:formate hydrogenlyase transcriptional activator
MTVGAAGVTARMTDDERRAALALELQWLGGVAPLDSEGTAPRSPIDDGRVAAIVATALLSLPSDAVDEAITRALAAVGLQRDVERAFYYRLDAEVGAFVLTHEWHRPGRRPLKAVPAFARLPLTLLPPPFLASLRRGGVLRLPRTHSFLAAPVEDLIDAEGDRAIALCPVVVHGGLVGIAGFAAAREEVWETGDTDLLQVVAQGVARTVERQYLDRALQASEERFRAMCDASPLGIFLAGRDGECVYLNPAAERICGLPPEEAAGRGWMNALHPEDRERVVRNWGSAVASNAGYETPIHRFVHRDGDVRMVEVRAVPVVGRLGDRGFLGILEDVTARVRAESERRDLLARAEAARAEAEAARQEAETARAEVASILARISDGFIALDLQARYTYANDKALAMMKRRREEIIGQSAWEVFPHFVGTPFQQAYVQAVREQRSVVVEVPGTEPARCYEGRVYPSATGVSVFFEDISDRKLQEEQLTSDREYLRQEVGGLEAFSEIVGLDPGLRRMMESVSMVAATNTNVLVTGETGTGKELVARAIHERSPRRERLLVKVNCAAISTGLVESELFGHEKGAFTGALQRRKGRFELAHGGTLFLDEIGELPLETQVKLLRVLQEREFERVGGSQTIRVDVRVVAATNRNLPEMVAAGRFREDLYYRLAVFPVNLPPLRERADDIPLLVHSFLRRFARQAGRRIDDVTPEAMRRLTSYRWPGNVRELQNVIERAVILSRRPVLDVDALADLSPVTAERTPPPVPVSAPPVVAPSGGGATRTIEEVERGYVSEVLAETGWVIEGERGAARRLGLHPNTLRSRLKRWGLTRPSDEAN